MWKTANHPQDITDDRRNKENSLRAWIALAASRHEIACSACRGTIVLDGGGKVLFCDDCLRRARSPLVDYDLGGGD